MHSLTPHDFMDEHAQNQSSNSDSPPKSPRDCKGDPIDNLKKMFVDEIQFGRIKAGQCPARRPVFLRLHGVAHGHFEVLPDLPSAFQVGLFRAGACYPAWVRFSSDISDLYSDFKSTVGLGIKLFDVPGKKILSPDEDAPTADFLFQNMDVFFVDNAEEMCPFMAASLSGKRHDFLKDHPRTKEILDAMRKVVPTVLGTDLWSVIPFHFGEKWYCKYKLEPEVIPGGDHDKPDYDDPNYMRVDLEKRLAQGEARFRFLVQLQIDDKTMPLDKATVRWDEAVSKPIHVGTLVLPRQDITARGQAHYGETLSFNPWRTIEEHKPIGSIAEVRKVVYPASAQLRRNVNGQPIGEPEEARPKTVWPAGNDIAYAKIHPAIGVARLGNSTAPGEDGYYVGPEVTDPIPMTASQMRDETGALKRQAAHFRIYGYNAAGEVVGELNAYNALVEWTGHLANKKAHWYEFNNALDISEGIPVPRRNSSVTGKARGKFAIDPRPRTIVCRPGIPQTAHFDTGTFMHVPVPLGEMKTDKHGRLLVLGGWGRSASPTGQPVFDRKRKNAFNNANEWYDDTSDGPVTAKVTINGREIPVEPAWVVVAPPNYAPNVISWNTMYDLMVDTYVKNGMLPMPDTVSFTKDVLPVLGRLSNLQWVNKGFAAMFGHGGPMNFDDHTLIKKLATKPQKNGADPYKELRRTIYNAFRQPGVVSGPGVWPWIYGDSTTIEASTDNSSHANVQMLDVRSQLLKRWVAGHFVNDWDPTAKPPQTIDQVPLAEQPAMLDQAALHFCVADAFHPGCEMTWPMRHASMYSAPFRIRHRNPDAPEPDYGKTLTPAIALRVGGPLYAQAAGDITRWMALPWQGDTAYCRSGYEADYDPYVPTFWPARVPNQVLTAKDYATVIDQNLPDDERIAAFNRREQWLHVIPGYHGSDTNQVMMDMIKLFGKMGIVEVRHHTPSADDWLDFPEVMMVESLPGAQAKEQTATRQMLLRFDASLSGADDVEKITHEEAKLREAGWVTVEQFEVFRKVRMRS